MAGKPVKIAILADSREAVRGFDKAGDAAKDAGNRFDSVAESSDQVASKGAQAAGALSGLGDLIGGKFGAAMQTGGIAMQAAADSGDLLNVITESAIIRKVKDTAVTVAQTTATIAKTAADKAAAAGARVWAAAQWALNAAMSANPLGLVVIAVMALVAALVLAWKKSETFRAIVTGAWSAISAATSAVWGAIKATITRVVGAIGTAIRFYFTTYKTIITGIWNAITAATAAVWNGITGAVRGALGAVTGLLRGLHGKISGIFAGAKDWLLGAGKAVIQGLIDGLDAMVDKLKSKLGGITKLIPIHKGPPAKDRRLLRGAGELIMGGLIDGIDAKVPTLKRSLDTVTGVVTQAGATLTSGAGFDATTAGGALVPQVAVSGAGGGAVINLTVTGALDPDATARQIVRLLADLGRRLGVPVTQLLGGAR